MRFLFTLGAIVPSLFLVYGGTAHAQVIVQDLTALGTTQNPSQDTLQADTDRRYAAQGWRFGPWSIEGGASQGTGYTNNADRLDGGKSSIALKTDASLLARLSKSASNLELGGNVDSLHYPSVSRQNQTNWGANLSGNNDMGINNLFYSYAHNKRNQMPTDLGALAISQPIPYTTDVFSLSDRIRESGRLSVTTNIRADRFVFASIPNLQPFLQQTYRNRFLVNENVVLRYSLAQDSTLLAAVQGTQIRYTTDAFNLPHRDSNGFAVMTGYDYAFPGPFQFRVLGGYQRRQYISSAYHPFGTFYAELRGTWVPTRMTQMSLSVSRGIADGAFENVIGFVYTVASLHVHHIYSRNLTFDADFGVQHGGAGRAPDILQNTPLYQDNQAQMNYVANISFERHLNRHLSIGLINQYQNANASGSKRYSIDSVMFNLRYAL